MNLFSLNKLQTMLTSFLINLLMTTVNPLDLHDWCVGSWFFPFSDQICGLGKDLVVYISVSNFGNGSCWSKLLMNDDGPFKLEEVFELKTPIDPDQILCSDDLLDG